MQFPLDRLQRLQPLVHFDGLFAKTSRGPAVGVLQTASGCRHDLGRIASWRVLTQHAARINRDAYCKLIEAAIATKLAGQADVLHIVVDYLIPTISQRDFGGEFSDDPTLPTTGSTSRSLPSGSSSHDELPPPQLPSQTLLWMDRLWKLVRKEPAVNALRVEYDGLTYGLNGEYWTVRSWEANWRQRAQAAASRAAAAQSVAGAPPASPLFMQAQQSLINCRAFECGDVLFLAGNPPRLGHIVPRHHNCVLRRMADREFAITTALTPTLQASELCGFRRGSSGHWELHTSSICLGAHAAYGTPSSPWIALWAFLRFAAQRIATNGAFHERERESD